MLAENIPRATKADTHSMKLFPRTVASNIFYEGNLVLVVCSPYFTATKWPPFEPKFYGPVKVVKAQHLRYGQLSSTGQHAREPMHARRLSATTFVTRSASKVLYG